MSQAPAQPIRTVQKDAMGNPVYTPNNIAIYEATLAHEARRMATGDETDVQRAFRVAREELFGEVCVQLVRLALSQLRPARVTTRRCLHS